MSVLRRNYKSQTGDGIYTVFQKVVHQAHIAVKVRWDF